MLPDRLAWSQKTLEQISGCSADIRFGRPATPDTLCQLGSTIPQQYLLDLYRHLLGDSSNGGNLILFGHIKQSTSINTVVEIASRVQIKTKTNPPTVSSLSHSCHCRQND